jgi:hypothetical protein
MSTTEQTKLDARDLRKLKGKQRKAIDLTDAELQKLADVLEALETISYNANGIKYVDMGYSLAELADYDDETIYVAVQYGEQGSSPRQVTYEDLEFPRADLLTKTANDIALAMH